MERISAACAMDWSIELEKSLRSNNPGCQINAISQIGQRLQQWSKEPNITLGVANIYSLIPGEDRLFANTILLRLADAFCNGDNCVRRSIVNIFLLECRNVMKMGRKYNGIVSKGRVPNYVELLKRVKMVFDTGDVEAKGLCLRLFGCWADLGVDSMSVRHVILMSLQSSLDIEVKAALFASGCFCRLSDDFACIVLELLIGILSSPQTSPDVKLVAIWVFSKMRCTSSIANRCYKVGKMLMLSLQQDELKAEMLSSLSKLTFCSSILISQQCDCILQASKMDKQGLCNLVMNSLGFINRVVPTQNCTGVASLCFMVSYAVDLLLSSVTHESLSLVRARALKCLYFLLGRGACYFTTEKNVLAALLNTLDDKELSPNFRCEILRIFRKIFCSIPPDLPGVDMADFLRLVLIVKSAAQSSFKEERHLAIYLLVNIFCGLRRKIREHWSSFPEKWDAVFSEFQRSDGHRDVPELIVCDVILLIIIEINFLVKQLNFEPSGALSRSKQEFSRLLNFILHLIYGYPSLSNVVLDRLRCLVETLVSVEVTFNMKTAVACGGVFQAEIGAEKLESVLHPHGKGNKKEKPVVSELILCICRFTVACLNILDETGAINNEVYHIAKSLVKCIRQNGSCRSDTYEIFSVDLLSDIKFISCRTTQNRMHESQESKIATESGFSHKAYWVAQERSALEFSKKMLRKRSYWEAYRVGVHACYSGAWYAAAFTFRKLIDGVQSDIFCSWIRSLMLLAGGESEIKLILFPKIGIAMINRMQTEYDCGKTEMEDYSGGGGDLCGCEGKFAKIHGRICSSEEILAASGATDGVYYFQRWFLRLRTKVLEIVVDMLGLLDSHAFHEEQYNKGLVSVLQTVPAVASEFASLSRRLNNLAKEYDLLAVSFMDIDPSSFQNISKHALSCSVLALCTSFAVYLPNSPAYNNAFSRSLGNAVKISQSTVLKDLIERFWNIDEKITTELQQLMTVCVEVVCNLQSRTETNSCVLVDRASLSIYKCFIGSILQIQEDSKKVKYEEGLHEFLMQGIQVLSGIIKKWLEIPCTTPKYFFRVRSCVGAELFIFNADSKTPNVLSITAGSQLSLNLCIKLKNASKVPHLDVAKIYCVLAVRSSDRIICTGGKNEKQAHWGFQALEAGQAVELYDMLLHHMKSDSTKASRKNDVNGGGLVTCVCFEINQRGQGFSTCLVDVSALPEGLYPIKWHSCCVNKKGRHWSLLPLNPCSFFTIMK